MCGLLTYFGDTYSKEVLIDNANKIKYRGPDNSKYEKISSNISFIFHRLSIIDTSDLGNQPLHLEKDPNISIVCNGEIYNYKELISKYNFDTHSGSDCEVILHLYKRFGIKKALEKLDGVFAFVLYDANINMLFEDSNLILFLKIYINSPTVK